MTSITPTVRGQEEEEEEEEEEEKAQWIWSSLLSVCPSVVLSEPSHSDEEVEAQGGRDVQRLQAQGGWRVREEDRESLFCVHEKLRGVVSVLKTTLETQNNTQVKQVNTAA